MPSDRAASFHRGGKIRLGHSIRRKKLNCPMLPSCTSDSMVRIIRWGIQQSQISPCGWILQLPCADQTKSPLSRTSASQTHFPSTSLPFSYLEASLCYVCVCSTCWKPHLKPKMVLPMSGDVPSHHISHPFCRAPAKKVCFPFGAAVLLDVRSSVSPLQRLEQLLWN